MFSPKAQPTSLKMDHLPYPEHLGVPPIAVPYMPGYEYDHLDYESFPHRQGFIKNRSLDADRTCHEVTALAQSWLFFGLIEEFVGRPFDKRILIRINFNGSDAEESLIDTTRLTDILPNVPGRRYDSPQRLEELESRQWSRMQRRLAVARSAIYTLERQYEYDIPCSAVFLSIRILLIYLTQYQKEAAVDHCCGHMTCECPTLYCGQYQIICPGRWKKPGEPTCFQLLVDRMRQSGWCLHQIMQILRSYDCLAIYYLSSIRRPEVWGISHDTCTEEKCLAYNTKQDDTYEVRHVEEGCQCHLIGAPSEQIAQIITDGGIPLIEIRNSYDNAPNLRVQEYTPGVRYTAISHVWIDGLGNPTANALPTCQLRELSDQLHAVSKKDKLPITRCWQEMRGNTSTLFWMDTFCIPVNPERNSEREILRKKSINRMALIYKSAERVLVRDKELMCINWSSEPEELIYARVGCCRWNSRCWTLQEGALGNSLIYQFRNTALSTITLSSSRDREGFSDSIHSPSIVSGLFRGCKIDSLISYFKRSNRSALSRPRAFDKAYLRSLFWNAAKKNCDVRYTKSDYLSSHDKVFIDTWNNLGQRSTSMAEDIHVILANLADFSAAQIMSFPSAVERTKIMLYCIESFPLDLLFVGCSRPGANGNHADRWIPAAPGPSPVRSKALLQYTRQGLEFHAKTQCNRDLRIFIADEGSYLQRFHFSFSYASFDIWALIDCVCVDDDQLPRDQLQSICLLLDFSYVKNPLAANNLRGARFYVRKETRDPWNLRVRYDCPFKIRLSSSSPSPRQLERYPRLKVTEFKRRHDLIIEQSKFFFNCL